MFLNSVILGNILNHEKCELKNSIDVYMDSKIKDFKVMMKKSVDDMPSDIKFAFESFLKSCIHHFKMTDHTELVQAEYDKEEEVVASLEEEGLEDEVVAEEESLQESLEDEKMRSLKVKMEYMYLDNFVKSTTSDIFVPHQKNVVLENDSNKKEIKEKGKKKTVDKLRKKKNIDINYENTKNEKDS